MLAGGVALYATNEFLTISLLPSAVADIGGQRLYAWVTTVYLVASVVAATTVSALLARFGPRSAYLWALAVFGLGSVRVRAGADHGVLLVGRVVQGAAGGLLAGLGYAVINSALPQSLWTRASALVSAMWGVGTLVGPAAGGLFAQFGIVALGIRRARGPDRRDRGCWCRSRCPGRAGAPADARLEHPGVVAAAAGLRGLGGQRRRDPAQRRRHGGAARRGRRCWSWCSCVVDRRAGAAVLPPSAFRPGPLKWIYLTLGLLMAATMVDMYVPLFGQRLAHLVPVVAGFLGVALAVGWTSSEIVSASVSRPAWSCGSWRSPRW